MSRAARQFPGQARGLAWRGLGKFPDEPHAAEDNDERDDEIWHRSYFNCRNSRVEFPPLVFAWFSNAALPPAA